MKFAELLVLLPCHSLEDFPVHHEGEMAEGLLAGWTALWHPNLIASAGSAPGWAQIDDPPSEHQDRLIVIPTACRDQLPVGWTERAREDGALVLEYLSDRREILEPALQHIGGSTVDAELAADFLALGFCYLQVELLTRQMRYASNVDEDYFQRQVLEAAQAAVAGETPAAQKLLGGCFDILAEARDQFYPVESYLVDLLLVAPSTLGEALRTELAQATPEAPVNVLISGEALEQMAGSEPDSLTALRDALDRQAACLIGGPYREIDLSLMPLEVVLADLRRGAEAYQKHLDRCPQVFGRREFGLFPQMAQLLAKLGYSAALHISLAGGRFPQGDQNKCRWEGPDGSTLDVLTRPPLDATSGGSFINLAQRLGDSMDHDHVAVLNYAHWPGIAATWLDDLRRTSRRSPALGRFFRLDEFFSATHTPDMLTRFEADEYLSPRLAECVAAGESNPISSVQARIRQAAADADQRAAELMAAMVDTSSAGPLSDSDNAAERLARRIAPADPAGRLLVNPSSYNRRWGLELDGLAAIPGRNEVVRAAGAHDGTVQVVADIPAMGFAWVGGQGDGGPHDLPLAEEQTLRNEHFEAHVNPTTGALASIHHYNRRGNLVSQQIAFRIPEGRGDGPERYSVMAADEVRVTMATPAVGEITSRGRLLTREGALLAEFTQKLRLWRGSHVLDVDITLDPKAMPGKNPWDSYYAARFAWHDAGADTWRSVSGGMQPSVLTRIEAPLLVDVRSAGGQRLAILTGGLPYHRRTGTRMLDSILMVHGEEQRHFQLGIGIDVTHPTQLALDRLSPAGPMTLSSQKPAAADCGWFAHVSAKNVIATDWAPRYEGEKLIGFSARLLETEGRSGRVALSANRDIRAARQLDYRGQTMGDLPVEDGKAMIDATSHEWIQIEADW